MNKNLKVIAISGKAQHGKDTFAKVLQEVLTSRGKKVLLVHYADLLKYICKTFFNWNGEKDEKGRHILQYVGTDVVRKERPDYWVDFIIDMINLFGDNWDYVIIPDTRFPNEIERLKEAGLKVTYVRVVRPDFDNGLTEEQKNHPSEIALDDYDCDYTVNNIEGLDFLRDQAALLSSLLTWSDKDA